MCSSCLSTFPAKIPGVSSNTILFQRYSDTLSVATFASILISLFPVIAEIIVDLPELYCPTKATVKSVLFLKASNSAFSFFSNSILLVFSKSSYVLLISVCNLLLNSAIFKLVLITLQILY